MVIDVSGMHSLRERKTGGGSIPPHHFLLSIILKILDFHITAKINKRLCRRFK